MLESNLKNLQLLLPTLETEHLSMDLLSKVLGIVKPTLNSVFGIEQPTLESVLGLSQKPQIWQNLPPS